MVSVHGYNKEKEPRSDFDIYIKVIFFGIVLACMVIVGGLGIRFLIKLMIEYWAWALGAVMFIIIVKKFFLDRMKKGVNLYS